jgi:two-component system sensor histidine kinase/response regulator
MGFNIGSKVLFMNSFTWIFMSVISFIAYQNLQVMKQTSYWVDHTHQVLSNVSKIEKSVLDMETGERGYLIVGKDDFLIPYKKAKQDLSNIIHETNNLVSDNPKQISNLEKINKLIELWHIKAGNPEIKKRKEVNANKGTLDEVVALVEKRTGKRIMDDIRDELLSFKNEENTLMNERKLQAHRKLEFTEYAIILGTLVVILFSHVFSLILTDNIKKPIEKLRLTIKDIGFGIVPSKTQIESNMIFSGLEESFEKIATTHKLAKR